MKETLIEISRLNSTTHDQAQHILDVQLLAYQVEADLLQIRDFFPLQRTVLEIQTADAEFFGVRSDGKLAAVIEVELVSKHEVNVASLVVLPTMFRRGYGSALLRHVLETYPEQSVTVSTAKGNIPAIALYKKHGFEIAQAWQTPDHIAMVTLRVQR